MAQLSPYGAPLDANGNPVLPNPYLTAPGASDPSATPGPYDRTPPPSILAYLASQQAPQPVTPPVANGPYAGGVPPTPTGFGAAGLPPGVGSALGMIPRMAVRDDGSDAVPAAGDAEAANANLETTDAADRADSGLAGTISPSGPMGPIAPVRSAAGTIASSPVMGQVLAAPKEIGDIYGALPQRNFAQERRNAFIAAGIGGVLAHVLGGNAPISLAAAGAAGQGNEAATEADWQARYNLAGARAKAINETAANAARVIPGYARAAVGDEYTQARISVAQAQAAGAAAKQAAAAKAATDAAYAKGFPDAQKSYIDYATYLRNLPDSPTMNEQIRGQALETYRQNSPYGTRFAPLPRVVTGYAPVTHTDQGTIIPAGIGNSLDAKGNVVQGGGAPYGNYETPEGQSVRDPFIPALAGPRPPEIQQTAAVLPADTTEQDNRTQALRIANDKQRGDIRADIPNQVQLFGRLTPVQQVQAVRNYNATNAPLGISLPAPGEGSGLGSIDQNQVLRDNKTPNPNFGKWVEAKNPFYGASPDDDAKMAQAAQQRALAQETATRTGYIPTDERIKQQAANAQSTSAGAAAQNASTNALRGNIELNKFRFDTSKYREIVNKYGLQPWPGRNSKNGSIDIESTNIDTAMKALADLQLKTTGTTIDQRHTVTDANGNQINNPTYGKPTQYNKGNADTDALKDAWRSHIANLLGSGDNGAGLSLSDLQATGGADGLAGQTPVTSLTPSAPATPSPGPTPTPGPAPLRPRTAFTPPAGGHSPIDDSNGANVPNNYGRPGYVATPNNGDWVKGTAGAPAPYVPIRITNRADIAKVPPGGIWIAPDGTRKIKPIGFKAGARGALHQGADALGFGASFWRQV